MTRTLVVVGGALIACGLAVLAYNLFGLVSHVVIWRENERFGIAAGVLILVGGVLLYGLAGERGECPKGGRG